MKAMSLVPVVSEKALGQAENARTYAFIVPKGSSKIAIAAAIAKQFGVKVEAVNTVVAKGKAKSTPVQRGRLRIKGVRSNLKKAYVKLADGETIKLFEETK